MKEWSFRIVLVVGGLVASVFLAEIFVRMLHLAPEVTFIRKGRLQLSRNVKIGYEPVPSSTMAKSRPSTITGNRATISAIATMIIRSKTLMAPPDPDSRRQHRCRPRNRTIRGYFSRHSRSHAPQARYRG